MFKVANVGSTDRIVRIVLGVVLLALVVFKPIALMQSSAMTIVALIAAVVLIGTAVVRFCPAYKVIGASTCSNPNTTGN